MVLFCVVRDLFESGISRSGPEAANDERIAQTHQDHRANKIPARYLPVRDFLVFSERSMKHSAFLFLSDAE